METAFHYPPPRAVAFKKKKKAAISLVVDLLKPFANSSPQSLSAPNWFPSPFSHFLHNNYAVRC
jgi:hypothetical protein